jgi:micrococcal nuclease
MSRLRSGRAACLSALAVRHVDGDTLGVRRGERVRLIGVDTPETKHPKQGAECFGTAASAFLVELLPVETEVRLVYDVEREDRYGRILAYLYRVRDGLFVNAELVRTGYAQAYTVPPNIAHAEEFLALQARAREAERGLWDACEEPTVSTSVAESADGARHASYPDVCIPPPPPKLHCGDVSSHTFRVEGEDPHGFDADADGIGCEGSRDATPPSDP